ncbi:MAG: hypothetical protein CMB36_07630 [Euryarchaeota archaeon]|nr:hypothetical protein [Euryarchaeota archaeon]
MDNVSQKPERRYDIDWLRVILFGLLIPFHVAIGVYWSTYGEDINPNITDDPDDRKEIAEEGNDYTYDSVDPTSMFLHWMHQWRLAALFMISGMGTAFAFKRRSWKTFLTERLQRLLVPMFFGMWTVGFAGGIITGSADLEGNTILDTLIAFILHVFLTSFVFWVPLFGKIIALGHLWFLWNLFLYSLLCVPIFHIVQKNVDGNLATALRSIFTIRFGLGIFILFPTLLAITELVFKPWFPGFIGIGYEWVWYLAFFLFGYICIISRDRYYEFLDTNRKVITVVTMLLTITFVIIRLQQHEDGVPYMDGGWIEQGIFHNEMTVLSCFIHSFHAWFWCLTIFAWGSHLLNKRSSSLTYLNQGVYPFYIVHMPITFAGLKIAKELNFTGIPAVIAGCLIVLIGCWLVFEGVSRTRITRYLFGIKNIQQKQSVVTQDVS